MSAFFCPHRGPTVNPFCGPGSDPQTNRHRSDPYSWESSRCRLFSGPVCGPIFGVTIFFIFLFFFQISLFCYEEQGVLQWGKEYKQSTITLTYLCKQTIRKRKTNKHKCVYIICIHIYKQTNKQKTLKKKTHDRIRNNSKPKWRNHFKEFSCGLSHLMATYAHNWSPCTVTPSVQPMVFPKAVLCAQRAHCRKLKFALISVAWSPPQKRNPA